MKYHFRPDPEEHFMLHDMAEALDVDLAQAVLQRDLPVQVLSEMIKTCTMCTDRQYCDIYIKSHEHHVDHAPSYCPNHFELDALHEHRTRLDSKTGTDG